MTPRRSSISLSRPVAAVSLTPLPLSAAASAEGRTDLNRFMDCLRGSLGDIRPRQAKRRPEAYSARQGVFAGITGGDIGPEAEHNPIEIVLDGRGRRALRPGDAIVAEENRAAVPDRHESRAIGQPAQVWRQAAGQGARREIDQIG